MGDEDGFGGKGVGAKVGLGVTTKGKLTGIGDKVVLGGFGDEVGAGDGEIIRGGGVDVCTGSFFDRDGVRVGLEVGEGTDGKAGLGVLGETDG